MELQPGDECPECHRKIPHVHDKEPGPKQNRFTVLEPPGEGGTLDDLLVQLVERYQQVWPEDVGQLGEKGWRYRSLLFKQNALRHDRFAKILMAQRNPQGFTYGKYA